MTIFAILLPAPNPALAKAIETAYPNNWFQVTDTQFLVSSAGTIFEVSAKTGVADINNKEIPTTGNAIIFATSSYYGRAPTHVWDWIKAKLESPSNG